MDITELLRKHGQNDELNVLVDDKKRLKPSEREAIEAAQNVLMKAAKEIEELRLVLRARIPHLEEYVTVVYQAWPEDVKRKLSCHDLERMWRSQYMPEDL